jgi:hypothetical protein
MRRRAHEEGQAMSEQMPESCPFCGAGVLILDDGKECRTPDGSHLAFRCFTNWFRDRPVDRSDGCERAERNNLVAERDRLREQITTMRSSIETAWAIIANASGGDWDKQSAEWREAAHRWHDEAQPYTPNTGCDFPDRLRERVRRLEEAGDAMAKWLKCDRNMGQDLDLVREWDSAKEAHP